MVDPRYEQYRGMRGLLLTRVSTGVQEEKYSHTWQERQVRKLLVEPLAIQLDGRIVRYTYTGLEYVYNEALEEVLRRAQNGEFDLLLMEVLDRGLGRKALERELYRMQIRETGVHILTCDPEDFADDDSFTGQLMRFIRGYKSQQEVADTVRRSRGGKIAKATGDPRLNIPSYIVGTGDRIYGYSFVLNDKGVRIDYCLKNEVILVEPDGTEWTEVNVVVFIFESAASGVPLRVIARQLTEKGFPTPNQAKGKRHKRMKAVSVWQHKTIGDIIHNKSYYGEYRMFKRASTGRKPGKNYAGYRPTSEEEQIVHPIPAIITKALWEKANWRITANKQLATRNNKTSKEALLRGGFGRCAYCNGTLTPSWTTHRAANGEDVPKLYYNCSKNIMENGQRCGGCVIPVDLLDAATAAYIAEKIHDPSEVDQKIAKLTRDNPVVKQREKSRANLAEIRRKQKNFRKELNNMIQSGTIDPGTRDYLTGELNLLAKQEADAEKVQADEQAFQKKYTLLQERIAAFHQQCTQWRQQLDDPEFTPSFAFNREALLFLGISVTLWRSGTNPRFVFHTDPPEIMELLS
jgi:site-specific DNA recombinase